MIRAKAQMKVALLTALETPGGRIERIARQLLSWGRLISSEEIVAKVDALTVEQVREAGRRLLKGAPTMAAIGPIKGLPSLDGISLGSARLRFCAAPLPRSRSILLNPAANGPHCPAGNNNNRVLRTSRSQLDAPPCPQAS